MKRRLLNSFKILTVIAALCLAYGFLIEPRLLKMREMKITAKVTAPLKIALISDLHIGGVHVPANRIRKTAAIINTQNPDIIFLAGDYVNGHKRREDHTQTFNDTLDRGLAALSDLSAPMGVYAAMGNHDRWYSQPYLIKALTDAGATVLVNQAVNIGDVCIVGLADADTDTEDPLAFEACENGSTTLSLMHSPDSFKYLRSDTVFAVAGHTHGGQINLPLLGRAITATQIGKPYAYGLRDWRGIPVIITAGLGTSIMPARFRSPPEVVIINLVPAR